MIVPSPFGFAEVSGPWVVVGWAGRMVGYHHALPKALVDLATKSRIPTMWGHRQFVEAGGLMSYAVNFYDQLRRAAIYVDRILKGAKPGDLPVEQPTRYELVINLTQRRRSVSRSRNHSWAGADQVIE
jgi:putative ABC transport system substrate-binding protein